MDHNKIIVATADHTLKAALVPMILEGVVRIGHHLLFKQVTFRSANASNTGREIVEVCQAVADEEDLFCSSPQRGRWIARSGVAIALR